MYDKLTITRSEIESFCKLLSSEYGVYFEPAKYMYVENRVLPLMQSFKCESILDLYQRSKVDDFLKHEMINELTTNETWFFRHNNHFKLLENQIFDELAEIKKENKQDKIQVWSAGCSNGAEAYSILIAFLEWAKNKENIQINIVASDISTKIMKSAIMGIYSAEILKEVDCNIRLKYFDHLEYNKYKIKDSLKQYLTFENLNLVKTWPPRNFDLIFCRNTMFYFTESVKANLVERFEKALNEGGYLFTSTNELIDCSKNSLKKIFFGNEILYQKDKKIRGKRLFVFKNSSEMFKAVTLLQAFKCEFDFLFNRPGVKRKLAAKTFYIDNENFSFVIGLFEQNNITFEEEILFY